MLICQPYSTKKTATKTDSGVTGSWATIDCKQVVYQSFVTKVQ